MTMYGTGRCLFGFILSGYMWRLRALWYIYYYCPVDKYNEKSYFWCMKMVKRILFVLCISFSGWMVSGDLAAQCPMCKMSAESNLKNGGTAGKGLNAGILYMLALPYTLVGVIGFIWWKNNRRNREDEVEVLP